MSQSFNILVDELALITGQLLSLLPQQDWPRMNHLLHQRDALLAKLHHEKPIVPSAPEVLQKLESVASTEQALQASLLNQMAQVQQACQQLRTHRQQVGRYRSDDPSPHHTRAIG
ncbi:MAG: hypothetical protein QE263_08330 [Vampirovibrionales bacterium]|nr:hypothetical protein [Vampirovibrionales bacterium]